MTLAHEFIGEGRNATFIHGFTQTSQSWKTLLGHISTPLHSQLVDAPGHGNSHDAQRNLWESAHDIVGTMHSGVLVGYSMGARMCLHAALLGSKKIESLILISGTAGIINEEEREQRQKQDSQLADHICATGIDSFLQEWLQQPLFSMLTVDPLELSDRKRNTAQGLADSLRYAGVGTQTPLWGDLHKITVPVLLIAGALDTKFVHLAQQMHQHIAHSTLRIIPESGHSAHLEKPSVVATEIDAWLSNAEKNSH